MTELTQAVVEYQRSGEGLRLLVDQISTMVYDFPSNHRGFNEEDGAEFLLTFLPRITGLIRRYRETGQSFETYLSATLKWQLKSLASRRSDERLRCVALTGPGSMLRITEDARAANSSCEVHEQARLTCHPCKLSRGQASRLVQMSLKLAEQLGVEDYRRVARVAGCDPEWLLTMWEKVRAACDERRERRTLQERRRDDAWFQIRCLQYRLRLVMEDDERETINRRLAMWRRRFESARHVLLRMHNGPTNAEIAEVLGVPKGTVDSGLFYGKRELKDPAHRALLASTVVNP